MTQYVYVRSSQNGQEKQLDLEAHACILTKEVCLPIFSTFNFKGQVLNATNLS